MKPTIIINEKSKDLVKLEDACTESLLCAKESVRVLQSMLTSKLLLNAVFGKHQLTTDAIARRVWLLIDNAKAMATTIVLKLISDEEKHIQLGPLPFAKPLAKTITVAWLSSSHERIRGHVEKLKYIFEIFDGVVDDSLLTNDELKTLSVEQNTFWTAAYEYARDYGFATTLGGKIRMDMSGGKDIREEDMCSLVDMVQRKFSGEPDFSTKLAPAMPMLDAKFTDHVISEVYMYIYIYIYTFVDSYLLCLLQ